MVTLGLLEGGLLSNITAQRAQETTIVNISHPGMPQAINGQLANRVPGATVCYQVCSDRANMWQPLQGARRAFVQVDAICSLLLNIDSRGAGVWPGV